MSLVRPHRLNEGVPAARRGGRGFRPYAVAETVAWWTARAGVTGSPASAWTTQSPAGSFTGSQATEAKRPSIGTSINGRPSLDFAGASAQVLANTTVDIVSAGATRYVLAVVKASDAVGGTILNFRLNSTGGRFWSIMWQVIGSDTFFFTDGVAVSNIVSGAQTVDTAAHIIEWELTTGAPVVARVDGVAQTIAGGNIVAEAGTTGFRIGSRAGASAETGHWNGSIGDIYIASSIPSAANKSALRTYFAAENGVTL